MIGNLLEESANLFVGPFGRLVVGSAEIGDLRIERAAFLLPLDAPTVEQLGVGESEQLEYPERVRCPPVVLVTVEHDGGALVDSLFTQELLELLRRDVIAQHRIVEIEVPVHLLCSPNMSGVVKKNVLVALDDPDVRVVEMLSEPLSAHENFGMYVTLAGDVRIDGCCVGCD